MQGGAWNGGGNPAHLAPQEDPAAGHPAPRCTGGILCPSAFPSHALPGSEHQAAGVGAVGHQERRGFILYGEFYAEMVFVLYEATPRQGGRQRGAAPALRAMQNAIPPPSFCTRGLLAAAL